MLRVRPRTISRRTHGTRRDTAGRPEHLAPGRDHRRRIYDEPANVIADTVARQLACSPEAFPYVSYKPIRFDIITVLLVTALLRRTIRGARFADRLFRLPVINTDLSAYPTAKLLPRNAAFPVNRVTVDDITR